MVKGGCMDITVSISEEIADVQIMLAQMILLFNLESEVEKWRNTKLERLRDRLSEVTA